MFENIIGQDAVIRTISRELETRTFPRAVLFCGPAYSGRLSAALEAARVLTCEGTGEWRCLCAPCQRQRLLLHPYTVLAGYRAGRTEFRAARDTLRRDPSQTSRYFFLRAVRKLTRRFDPHIFQAEEGRRREIQDTLLSLEDGLLAVEPGRELPEGKAGEKLFSSLESLCERLENFLPKDNVPIAVIRNISLWANYTAPGAGKIVILDSAARLLESSRNALLKILEEPPPTVSFILIAERPSDLIPTIRSRLRVYRFLPRAREETAEILKRVFREENPEYSSLKSYFLAWEDIRLNDLRAQAERFTEKLLENRPVLIQHEIPELFKRDAPREMYRYFLEELIQVWQALLRRGEFPAGPQKPPLERLEAWIRLIRARAREFFTLNISPSLFIEGLYLSLRQEAAN